MTQMDDIERDPKNIKAEAQTAIAAVFIFLFFVAIGVFTFVAGIIWLFVFLIKAAL